MNVFLADRILFDALHTVAGTIGALDAFAVFCASFLLYVMVVVFVGILISRWGFGGGHAWRRRWYQFCAGALALLLARGIVTEIIKFFVARSRPYAELVFSPLIAPDFTPAFPSGHAAAAFALATIVFFFHRRWGYGFLVAAVLVAIARVYVGVHWPSDIIAGALIGAVSAWVVRRYLPRPPGAELSTTTLQ